jgi:cytochrome c oxidase subunit 2
VGKGWSIFFGVVLLACLLSMVAAPLVPGWWVPEGLSTHSASVDWLFYMILGITGFFFVLTELILVVFMFKFAGQPGQKGPPASPGGPGWVGKLLAPFKAWIPDEHRLEMAWTAVPAAILLFIAFAQISAWAQVKYQSRLPGFVGDKALVQLEVSARQFEWRIRYPSLARVEDWFGKKNVLEDKDFKSFADRPQADDVHNLVNEIHIFRNHPVLIHLKSIDVLHSLNLPHFRVKQDAVPGKTIKVWFIPGHPSDPAKSKYNTKFNPETKRWEDGYNPETKKFGDTGFIWELACAELCGWGHSRMVGRIYVHENQEDFLAWLKHAEAESNRKTTAPPGK